ncbi:MAG: glycosyltransferase, partial [Lachnospiraceae bacterium]|nr:glycosyltransferase [Lachnospiraceae bacterium]
MIKVSVIIPVYNTAPYLRACLDSIVGQTLQDIEIICINDGSKDESPEILNEYAKRDSRVSVYSQDNSGLSSVRNRGVRFAHGKYLYFIDSDDLIEKDALRQLWDMSEKKALDVLYFDADCFADSEDCREICEEKREYYERKGDYGGVYEGQLLFKSFLDNEEYRVNVGIQFINREFFISADLWFIEGILHEDEFFTFKTMLSAKRASHLKRKLFHRRYRSGSVMTSKQSFGDAYGHFRSYLEMCGFIEKIRLLEKCKTSALEIIRRRITNARDIYENLQDDEREKYLVLSQYERMIFKLYVVDYERLRKDSKDKFEISEKLKQAYEEKSEINAKLKTAYEE